MCPVCISGYPPFLPPPVPTHLLLCWLMAMQSIHTLVSSEAEERKLRTVLKSLATEPNHA